MSVDALCFGIMQLQSWQPIIIVHVDGVIADRAAAFAAEEVGGPCPLPFEFCVRWPADAVVSRARWDD